MSISLSTVRRRTTSLACLTACLAGALSGGALTTSTATTALPAAHLEAQLTSSGDPNGSGEVMFMINRSRGRVCATVEWRGIKKPMAAHIHRRSDGEVVVDLSSTVTGGANCATGVSKSVIGRILDTPGRYYFNVHNKPYPAGAIQGRLHR